MCRRYLLLLVAFWAVTQSCGCRALGLPSPLASFERSQVYHPVAYPIGDWEPEGLEFEDVWIKPAREQRVHGWFVPCENPRAVILFAHGNAGNVTHRTPFLKLLHDRHRVAVLSFDYRGFGRSTDIKLSEKTCLQDARAARKWLAKRMKIQETDIVMMGRSFGGGIAVDLAANDGAAGLVLDSTFTSLPDVAEGFFPWLPVQTLMENRLDSLSKVGQYQGPLVQSHGDADRVVPYELGRRLYDAAPGRKRFVTLEGGGHHDSQGEEYHQALDDLFESLTPVTELHKRYAYVRPPIAVCSGGTPCHSPHLVPNGTKIVPVPDFDSR
ncbi:MAG: alpha/beta hydrolase [Planctomycetaceae bacterium]|nr:alpha/beta hydrolase [Planctomycetaceae bacterium]